jgi:hypothetical protein
VSISAQESPFRTVLYTKEDLIIRFNYEMDKLNEEGWVVGNVVWSPDSQVAIVTYTRFVQPNSLLSGLFGPQGAS